MTGTQKVVLLACGSYNPITNMHLRMFEIARDHLHRSTNYHVVAGLISPVHDKYGKDGLVASNDRCQMVRLALTSSSWIHLSDWETRQEEWTPTREVIQYHQHIVRSYGQVLRASKDSHNVDLMDSAINGNIDGPTKRQRLDASVPWLAHLTQAISGISTVGGVRQHEPVLIKLLCGADLLQSFGKPGLWKDEDIETIVGKHGIVVISREGSNPYKFIYESDVLSRLQRNIHIVTEWIPNEISSTRVRRGLRRGESVKYLLQDAVIDYIQKHVLYDTHNNSKYMLTPAAMLTPSPNPDTDVLIPPPSFTISQQQQKIHRSLQPTLQSQHHLAATLTRQHARQNSTPSDMEQDTPPGLSPVSADLMQLSLVGQLPASTGMRLYPGQARPVKQRSGEVGLVAAAASGKATAVQQPTALWRDLNSTGAPTLVNAIVTSAPQHSTASSNALTPTHIGVDRLLESTKKELSALAAKSSSLDFPANKAALASKNKKSGSRNSLLQSNSEPSHLLIKSHSISPKKGPSPIPDVALSKKIFTNHNRSKSSISLKPERAYDINQNSRDDSFVRFRELYTRSLSTGSNIYDLLSRTRDISPSHTEICLTHVPSRHHDKPIVPRARNGDRLFTSRSLERPSTPRMERTLSPPRKVASLPISRGRSRERSPSPYYVHHAEPRKSIDMQMVNGPLSSKRGSIVAYDVTKMGTLVSGNFDQLDIHTTPRALTHEEEINMIITGESANYLRMSTPDSFPTTDAQSSESVVSNESEYEMRF